MSKLIIRPRRAHKRRRSLLEPGEIIDYNKITVLRRFVSEQGKILSRRVSRLTSKQQRAMTKAIKQARVLALLPFLNQES